jgi:PCFT/HCP family folate transporter-like MFS transporter 1/3
METSEFEKDPEGTRHGSNSNSTVCTAESDRETPVSEDNLTFSCFRNSNILTIEPVIFLYMFATYLYFPLYLQYFLNYYSLVALEDNTSYPYANETRCISRDDVTNYTGDNSTYNSEVQAKSSLLVIYVTVANMIPSVLVTLLLGPLSDRYGRRFVMVMVSVGSILQGIVAMGTVHFRLNIMLFILSSALAGLGGDFSAILMSCFSYVSDISKGKWRTIRISLGEAMLFLSGLVAQGLGGIWFQKLNCNIIPPLFLFLSCHVAIILYTLLFLPPSLTVEERKRKMVGRPLGIQRLVRGVGLFFCSVQEYSVWRLWFVLITLVVLVIITTGATSISVFFFRYLEWSSGAIGAYQAASMGSNAFFLLFGLPILVALKLPDPVISMIGVVVLSGGKIFMWVFSSPYQLFLGK